MPGSGSGVTALGGSPYGYGTYGSGSYGIGSTLASRFDVERLGMVPWASPRHSDLMIISGTVTIKMAPMLKRIYDLIDEADVVVHYNGKSFDMPTLSKEFIGQGWSPPAPSTSTCTAPPCPCR